MLTIYLCLDDRWGMLFNRRRQSRDIRVMEDMQTLLSGELYLSPYSEKMVREAGIPCRILTEASPEVTDYFAETPPDKALLQQANRLVVYRWNRHYPADTHWDITVEAPDFTLKEVAEFSGKSHEKITREVYTR